MLYILHDTPTFMTEVLCLARDVQLLNRLILNLVRQRALLLRPHLPTPSITGKTGKQYNLYNQLFRLISHELFLIAWGWTHTHAYIDTKVILRNQVRAWFNKKQQIVSVVNKGLIRDFNELTHIYVCTCMHARAHAHTYILRYKVEPVAI